MGPGRDIGECVRIKISNAVEFGMVVESEGADFGISLFVKARVCMS